MSQCPECGAENDAGADFCRKCSTYLGWEKPPPSGPMASVRRTLRRSGRAKKEGTERRRPARPLPMPGAGDPPRSEPQPPSNKTVAVPLSPDELRQRLAGHSPDSAPPMDVVAPVTPDGGVEDDRRPSEHDGSSHAPETVEDAAETDAHEQTRARRLAGRPVERPPVQGARPASWSDQPAVEPSPARTSSRAGIRRKTARAPWVDKPGEHMCVECNTSNPDTRRFCRRCGASLVDIPDLEPAPTPWWKFWVRFRSDPAGRHDPDKLEQGGMERFGSVFQALSSFTKSLLAVVLVGGLVLAAFNWGDVSKAGGDMKRRLFPKPQYVPIFGLRDKHDTTGMLVDLNKSNSWSSSKKSDTFYIPFDSPVELYKMGVLLGVSSDEQKFRAGSRPRHLKLTAVRAGGNLYKEVPLKNSSGFQTFSFSTKGKITAITGEASGCIEPTQGDKYCSIREIEFFRKV